VSLTAAEVAEIMRLIENSSFDELSLELDGVSMTLRRAGAAGGVVQSAGTPGDALRATSAQRSGAAAAQAAAPASVRKGAPAAAAAAADPNISDITSPMLGTFYRAPKPGSAPFVEIGADVNEDSVIAIIEVMKLMNTVRAGVKGTITEILPADETLVEFGEVLMRVRKGA
jgi:acetyl-CoA carboxylase biotin carboxyl carrier protein